MTLYKLSVVANQHAQLEMLALAQGLKEAGGRLSDGI
jgi:hypothetical protein